MEEVACAGTMAFGMEATAGGIDLLCVGEMGIGNTTIAAAIFAALYGGPARRIGWARAPGSTNPGSSGNGPRSGEALSMPSRPAG